MINVYWTSLSIYNALINTPVPVNELINPTSMQPETRQERFSANEWKLCPAIKDYYSNTFAFSSAKNMRFKVDHGNQLLSDSFEEEEEQHLVGVVSPSNRTYSINFGPVFFADTDSLVLEQLQPVMSGSNFSESVQIYQGHVDCAKYPRPLDCVFRVNDSVDSFHIKEADALFYIKFNTDEEINFIRFYPTPEIQSLLNLNAGKITRSNNGIPKLLSVHYDAFKKTKARKQLLKLIKGAI